MMSLFFIFIYTYIYTPSNLDSTAFSVFKINFETSFLYQLFKENSNIIVVSLYMKLFLDFHYYLYLFICIFMHLYLYFKYKNFKPCKMFIYVCMYVCMYACVYTFHSLKAMQHFHLCMYGCM